VSGLPAEFDRVISGVSHQPQPFFIDRAPGGIIQCGVKGYDIRPPQNALF